MAASSLVATATTSEKGVEDEMSLGRKMCEENLRIPVLGNVDAGKSTLIGTLQSSMLDNGRGSSRAIVMRQRHETETGRTSTAHSHLVGLAEDGEIVTTTATRSDHEVARKARRLVTLFDLPGHESYLNTTIHGITKSVCDYALILVNAKQSPTEITKRHLSICGALGIPMVVVLTKIDDCPKHVLAATKEEICTAIKQDSDKKPFEIRKGVDVDMVVERMDILTPVVSVSSVTGQGLPLLCNILLRLPKRRRHKEKVKRPFELLIEDIFTVTGVGIVVHGLVNAGEWRKGEPLFVGPMSDGTFVKTSVKSAQLARTPVDSAWAGHSVCFALSLQKHQKRLLRKGMVLLKQPITVPKTFQAEIVALRGRAPTITPGKTEVMAHILNIRQTARILDAQILGPFGDTLSCGSRAVITLEFVRRPEYVRSGMRLVLREGKFTAVGVVKKVQ